MEIFVDVVVVIVVFIHFLTDPGATCATSYISANSGKISSLAALGLIENNAPNITAAMLVSPLMGPVMSITFGTIISDRELMVGAATYYIFYALSNIYFIKYSL